MADSSLKLGASINVYNMVGRNYATLGDISMALDDYANALVKYKEGIQQAKLFKNSKSALSNLYRKLGEVYERKDSLAAASESYTRALELGEADYGFKSETNYLLAKLAYKEADYKAAYQYLQQYNLFHMEVYNAEKVRNIQEISTRYETEKKDDQLQFLSKDRELQKQILISQLQQIENDKAFNRQQGLEIDNFRLDNERQLQLLQIQQLALENNDIKQKEQAAYLVNTQNKLEIERKQKELKSAIIKNQHNWFISVSYTHLDVYKRQAYRLFWHALHILLFIEIFTYP